MAGAERDGRPGPADLRRARERHIVATILVTGMGTATIGRSGATKGVRAEDCQAPMRTREFPNQNRRITAVRVVEAMASHKKHYRMNTPE
jgi:hypothetical protein